MIDYEKISNHDRIIKVWEIPVCYDLEFATDINLLSDIKNLSVRDIITSPSICQRIAECFTSFQCPNFYTGIPLPGRWADLPSLWLWSFFHRLRVPLPAFAIALV